jgi:hypothetical protein
MLHGYIKMHGQQNVKFAVVYIITITLIALIMLITFANHV